jgi:hypothetical protein
VVLAKVLDSKVTAEAALQDSCLPATASGSASVLRYAEPGKYGHASLALRQPSPLPFCEPCGAILTRWMYGLATPCMNRVHLVNSAGDRSTAEGECSGGEQFDNLLLTSRKSLQLQFQSVTQGTLLVVEGFTARDGILVQQQNGSLCRFSQQDNTFHQCGDLLSVLEGSAARLATVRCVPLNDQLFAANWNFDVLALRNDLFPQVTAPV